MLERSLRNGQLELVKQYVDFEDSWPFVPVRRSWLVIDWVEPLGGPGSTQGCAP